MQQRRMDALPAMPNPLGLDARFLAGGPTAQLMWVRLPAGGRIPAHPATMVVDFVVLEGAGVAVEGEQRAPVSQGDLLRFEPGVSHGFEAGEQGLVVLAVKHAPAG